tara:strand:+ start:172 stop:669 length:498 start_codon:yes stop_codon:yes gene_type:complete
MSGRIEFTGSLEQEGVVAEFKNGMIITGSLDANTLQISGSFAGDGSTLMGIPESSQATDISFGSASADGTIAGPWITGSVGPQTIILTATSSTPYEHFTFLRDIDGKWSEEASRYLNNANGLQFINTLEQTLDTGIYRYLLLAVSTSQKKTRIKYTTVVINPNEL